MNTTGAQITEIDDLQAKMNQLMDVLLLQQSGQTNNQLEPADELITTPDVMAATSADLPPQDCYTDHASWPTSDSYKDYDWAPWRMFLGGTSSRSDLIDLNGDGLLDYFHGSYSTGTNATRRSCVMLNNGHGWDLVSRCYMEYDDVTDNWTLYGDCADV